MSGAFHVGVGIDKADLPPAWGRNAAGAVGGAPANVSLPVLTRRRPAEALRGLARAGEQAERDGCAAHRVRLWARHRDTARC